MTTPAVVELTYNKKTGAEVTIAPPQALTISAGQFAFQSSSSVEPSAGVSQGIAKKGNKPDDDPVPVAAVSGS
jgi:hypothetical protein